VNTASFSIATCRVNNRRESSKYETIEEELRVQKSEVKKLKAQLKDTQLDLGEHTIDYKKQTSKA
jgi:hypothetical protein